MICQISIENMTPEFGNVVRIFLALGGTLGPGPALIRGWLPCIRSKTLGSLESLSSKGFRRFHLVFEWFHVFTYLQKRVQETSEHDFIWIFNRFCLVVWWVFECLWLPIGPEVPIYKCGAVSFDAFSSVNRWTVQTVLAAFNALIFQDRFPGSFSRLIFQDRFYGRLQSPGRPS